MEETKTNTSIENRRSVSRNVIENLKTVVLLFLGALLLLAFVYAVQNRNSERQQRIDSGKVLDEIVSDMSFNDRAAIDIKLEFDTLNQSSVETLSTFINYRNVFAPLAAAYSEGEEQYEQVCQELCNELKSLSDDTGCGVIYLVNDNGEVILSSKAEYVGLNLSDVMTEQEIGVVTGYTNDESTGTVVNGTATVTENADTVYSPVAKGGYYTYSTLLTEYDGKSYFLVVSQPAELLDEELSDIRSIEYLIDGVTVGRKGFLFAVDSNSGEILFFNHGDENLTGKTCEDVGLGREAFTDGYSGYKNINGNSYYLVSRSNPSSTFGKDTVIVSAVKRSDMLGGNWNCAIIACLVFAVVAIIVGGYCMIIRTDSERHIIRMENRFRQNLIEESETNKKILSEDEIAEKTQQYIADLIKNGKDEKLKRHYLKNGNGVGRYFSIYTFSKLIPLAVAGVVIVFAVAFFSQTLLGLEKATDAAKAGLNDIGDEITWHNEKSDSIYSYIDRQYMAKTLLVADILEQSSDVVLNHDVNDDGVYIICRTDSNGDKEAVLDEYGNILSSQSNNTILQQICQKNELESITIFDNNGRAIITSSDKWYQQIPLDPADQLYPLRELLDGKTDKVTIRQADDNSYLALKYIGTAFIYYSYNDEGKTTYVSRSEYEMQKKGEWDRNPITRSRGLLLVEINEESFSSLTYIASMDYIMLGMHIYGADSFFMAMDRSDEHIILFAPDSSLIGKSAQSVGFKPGEYPEKGIYHSFERVDNIDYYISLTMIGDYYVSAMIPTSEIYSARNSISVTTMVFAFLFMLTAVIFACFSSDLADADYKKWILARNKKINGSDSFILSTPTGNKTTSSITKRFSVAAWNEKSPEQKLRAMIMWSLTLILAVFVVIIFETRKGNGSDSLLSYIFYDSWKRGFNVFSITQSIVLMSTIIIITKLAQLFVRSVCGKLGARVETTGDLVISVLKYGGIIGGIFYCLHLFGFDSKSLLASAGILSVVIGLGAKSLIEDILAGIFLIFEGEFQVGDIVTINDFRGQVLEIGVRTTKVMGLNNIKIFNNSSISGVVNMTQESSFVSIEVGIEYGESLERVENILKDGFPVIRKKLPAIIEGPYYKGVSSLADSSVNLLIVAVCDEGDTLQLKRDLNREIYMLFNRNKVGIPFPQVTVSYLEEPDKKASKKEQQRAEKFVDEQKEKSADIKPGNF